LVGLLKNWPTQNRQINNRSLIDTLLPVKFTTLLNYFFNFLRLYYSIYDFIITKQALRTVPSFIPP